MQSLRQVIGKNARKFLSKLGYDLVPKYRTPRVEDYLFQTFKNAKKVTYIQVGAHDGSHNDPISAFRNKKEWQGLLLEPNPAVFSRLEANLSCHPQHRAINVALAETSGTLPFYIVCEPEKCKEPHWADQISSFDQQHLMKMLQRFGHSSKESAELIKTLQVPTTTFADLMDQLTDQVDLIFIDAEGADYRLLKFLPFEKQKPKLIVFEHAHLSLEEKKEIPILFAQQGYSYAIIGEDIVAERWDT